MSLSYFSLIGLHNSFIPISNLSAFLSFVQLYLEWITLWITNLNFKKRNWRKDLSVSSVLLTVVNNSRVPCLPQANNNRPFYGLAMFCCRIWQIIWKLTGILLFEVIRLVLHFTCEHVTHCVYPLNFRCQAYIVFVPPIISQVTFFGYNQPASQTIVFFTLVHETLMRRGQYKVVFIH